MSAQLLRISHSLRRVTPHQPSTHTYRLSKFLKSSPSKSFSKFRSAKKRNSYRTEPLRQPPEPLLFLPKPAPGASLNRTAFKRGANYRHHKIHVNHPLLLYFKTGKTAPDDYERKASPGSQKHDLSRGAASCVRWARHP